MARIATYTEDSMKNMVRHQGVVETIEGERVRVRFVQHTACGSCQMAGHCQAAEAKEKVVDVDGADSSRLNVGDTVTVTTQTAMAAKALTVGFALPLLLMMAVMAGTKATGGSDALAAGAMLLALVPYYIIVWLCRKRLAKAITFRIEQ